MGFVTAFALPIPEGQVFGFGRSALFPDVRA